jgi:PIN domain nuclease of toxin-antitoxin system
VRLLVDTHVLIWALEGSSRLSRKGRELLRDPEHEHWVSAASVWEIAIKASICKLTLSRPLRELESGIEAAGFRLLDVTVRHAACVPDIDLPHADPFDRMLLAQCEVETLRLLSADAALSGLPSVLSI